jgi:uncharacterized protein (DUF342 family)
MEPENRTVDIVCIVQPGRMTASVAIDRIKDSSQLPTCAYQEVIDVLEANNVSHGIKKSAVEKAIATFLDTKKRVEAVVVWGTPPVKGADGTVEWLVPRPVQSGDDVEGDGPRLMRVSQFIRIKKGQPVCRLLPPGTGTSGQDVFGKPVAAENGSPAVLPALNGTVPNPQERDTLVSDLDGIAVYEKDEVRLYHCQFISGDISPRIGTVKVDGCVWVGGDVQSGAKIEATGHVEVRGTVEDAVITAKSVRVECGFINTGTASAAGTGSITARGDVQVNFIRNQVIKADGNIYVRQEAINASLYSSGRISITGKGLGLAGGSAFAVESMDLSALGSSTEAKTEIALGRDPKLWARRIALMDEIEKIKAAIPMLAKKLSDLEQAKKRGMAAFDKLIPQMEKVMENKTSLDMKRMADETELKAINSQLVICEEPKLRVLGEVHRGVTLDFLGFKRIIQKPTRHVMYFLGTGEILESVFSRT